MLALRPICSRPLCGGIILEEAVVVVTPTTVSITLLEIEPSSDTRQTYLEPSSLINLADLEPSSLSREVGIQKWS